MKSLLEVLKVTTTFLQDKGFPQPRREAEELLSRALDISRMQLYLEFERPLSEVELALCRSYLQRRLTHEPYGYILGKHQFMNCQLELTPAVLIPRQETEILADKIISEIKQENHQDKKLLDLCCGSGCLGLAIKKELPELSVTLSDLSTEALEVARKNGQLNSLDVEYVQGDLLQAVPGRKFDYIVCNPPYISEESYAGLTPDVKNFEPKLALVGGENGTEMYAKLAHQLPAVLNSGGKVWFEIGFDQGLTVPSLFNSPCWKKKILSNDWAGHNRFFFLEFE